MLDWLLYGTTAIPSHSTIASFVLLVTPPKLPLAGEGRMYALGSCDNLVILVLSPNMDPPVLVEEGSTAYNHDDADDAYVKGFLLTNTATLWPLFTSLTPSVSTSVDFPAPGGPDNPTLTVGCTLPSLSCLFLWERTCSRSHWDCLCLNWCVDSTGGGGEGGRGRERPFVVQASRYHSIIGHVQHSP